MNYFHSVTSSEIAHYVTVSMLPPGVLTRKLF